MRTSGLGERRGSSTSGVLPIDSTMLPKRPPQGLLRSSDMPRSPVTSKRIALVIELHQISDPAGREFDAVRRSGGSAGHGGKDDDGVAVGDLGVEPVEDPDVLVVEVDVDVAVEVAVLAEELRLGVRVLGR